MRNKRRDAFTLIELLMVIAIIGILAGILIPTVGSVRKQANVAASKAQLSNYVNAIQMFKGEYKFLPFAGTSDTTVDLSSDSVEFIETLSGRNATSGASKAVNGNRRMIAFHSFSESEFLLDPSSGNVSQTELADRFGNTEIRFRLDGDGDGFVTPDGLTSSSEPRTPGQVRANVTGWVVADDDEGYPGYALWD